MIWNKGNFYEQMSHLTFEEELIKYSLFISIENYEPTHFFIYPIFDTEECILESIDVVFCNKEACYNFYLILDVDDVVIDFDLTYGVNIKILEEKL